MKFYKNSTIKIKKLLTKLGATNIKITKGYYYHSGFFTHNNRIYYISTGDYRTNLPLLIRTAKDYTDYTGGENNHIENNALTFANDLEYFLYKSNSQ